MQRVNIALLGLMLATALCAQEEGKRVALVIGNDAYQVSPLKNAVNDAESMQKALEASGFRVIPLTNASKADMDDKIGQFLDLLGPDDTALFFYAGHGVQIDGENFLVPVDFTPGDSVSRAKFQCISMARVFEELARKRAKKNIVILDACRNNPVSEKYSLAGGLMQPQNVGKETLVAFSTSPGQVATDNQDGKNSWFTEALADLIAQPRMTEEINGIFTRVKKRVADVTEGRQTPWTNSSLTTKFHFHLPVNQAADNDPTLVEKWMQDALRREQLGDWDEAIDKLNQILSRKPGGALEQAAGSKLAYYTARKEAHERYDASDFKTSAKLFEAAIAKDPFAIDAAYQGVNSYLLTETLPDAIRLLKAIRVRGNSASIIKANAMLTALGSVYPEAKEELNAGIPQPPPIQEVFAIVPFGMPDWEAGNRVLHTGPVDLTRWVKEVNAAFPVAPPAPAGVSAPAAGSTGTPAVLAAGSQKDKMVVVFHVEIISTGDTRNLAIRRLDGAAPALNTSGAQQLNGIPVKVITDPPGAELSIEGDSQQHCKSPCLMSISPKQSIRAQMAGYQSVTKPLDERSGNGEVQIVLEEQFGTVKLNGAYGQVPVLVNGATYAQQVPVDLLLPVGKYQVRAVQQGRILDQQDVEVTPMATQTVHVKR